MKKIFVPIIMAATVGSRPFLSANKIELRLFWRMSCRACDLWFLVNRENSLKFLKNERFCGRNLAI
jgi:hypothetical protein